MTPNLQIFLIALTLSSSSSAGPDTWASLGSCNGTRQSPIDIPESSAYYDISLGHFQFSGYSNSSNLLTITNTGHTVEVAVGPGISVSAGGLVSNYTAVAFHFHWGNGSLGSEHRLSGKQFPMEMHIVHTKAGMSLTDAKKDPTGIAVLGFFIEVMESANSSQMMALSQLLPQVSSPGLALNLAGSFSLDDLLGNVNREEYYRYLGSLTTPTCDQAVVWTLFRNPIYVPSSVVQDFATMVKHNVSGSLETLVNNFRPPQLLGNRQVNSSFTSAATAAATNPATAAATNPATAAATNPVTSAVTTPLSGASRAAQPSAILGLVLLMFLYRGFA
ncbi:carbonic anhydrase 4-like [Gastrophryne carolinensis]